MTLSQETMVDKSKSREKRLTFFRAFQIFLGNNDPNTAKKNVLSNVLITRWLRFMVKESNLNWPCMRTEVYGVKQKPGKTSQNGDLCVMCGTAV